MMHTQRFSLELRIQTNLNVIMTVWEDMIKTQEYGAIQKGIYIICYFPSKFFLFVDFIRNG